MSDDGWGDDGPYDDYAGDGGYDDSPCDDYDDGEGGFGGDDNDEDVGTTGYAEVEEVDVGTTGYAEVEEVNDDNYRDAGYISSDNGTDDYHPNDNGSSDPSQDDKDRDEDGDEDGDDDGPTMSNYEYVKPWGGMHGFMRSYGIARTPEGHQEAGELGDAMMEAAHKNGNLK